MFYAVKCSECGRFFVAREIKSNYKACPSCGNKINWRTAPKKAFNTTEEARSIVTQLNDGKAMNGLTAKELYEKNDWRE